MNYMNNKILIKIHKDRIEWYNDKGQYHREDGPAIECSNGTKLWYLNGQRHRENGPAAEWSDGYKSWWLNGQLHREDGPAIEYINGTKLWYLNGQCFTEAEFNKRINNIKKDSCSGKTVIIDGQEYTLTLKD